MEDFIFGSFASDELKLLHERARARGIQHGAHITPADPQPGEPVMLAVTVGPDAALDHLACYYTADGQEPDGSHGVARVGQTVPLRRVAVEWSPFLWGYAERWEAVLPPQPEGTLVRYRISGWRDDGAELWADWPPVRIAVERATAAFFAGQRPPVGVSLPVSPQPTPFAYSVDRLETPAWARQAVVYQIFVDRFNVGGGRPFARHASLRDVFGGTLIGIAEKLDYIAALGATAIWLTPIFASPSVHRYDTTDFFAIDPRVGTADDLRALVQAAHARGIRIILDLVCNHVSNQHPFFQQARADPASPYRDWFTFDPAYPHGYRTFFNVAAMPRLNTAAPAVRDYLIDVARYWLTEYDVDGFRLDHANGPEHAFWSEFWRACKAAKADCWCFGEIVEPPTVLHGYLGRLDGTLDFGLCDLLRRAFARGSLDLATLAQQVERHLAFFPQAFSMPSFVDNHDMDRFLYLAGGEKRRLQLAALAQMTLPHPPIVYYGTEVGLSQSESREGGGGLELSRLPMPWDEQQDRALLDWYRRLIALRRAHPAIWTGQRTTLQADETTWCYRIDGQGETLVVALHSGATPRRIDLPASLTLRLQVGGVEAADGEVELASLSGGIWELD